MVEHQSIIGTTVEGVSYAGKSTTLRQLKAKSNVCQEKIIIVPEYSEIGDLSKIKRDSIVNTQLAVEIILGLEKRRTDYLASELAHSPKAVVLWDRSPISCLAFEYAASKINNIHILHGLADRFQLEYENGNILVPRKFFFLRVSMDKIREREFSMLVNGHRKNPEFLRDSRVMIAFNQVFQLYADTCFQGTSIVIDSIDDNIDLVARNIFNFAASDTASQMPAINYPKFVQLLAYV
ncbi:MAG: hypothetical protein Q7R97_01665 [Candidatus Daviesbacteria bacterium]|nr:hypothetical protein [Candidatus Daviesbacteria bacterium]